MVRRLQVARAGVHNFRERAVVLTIVVHVQAQLLVPAGPWNGPEIIKITSTLKARHGLARAGSCRRRHAPNCCHAVHRALASSDNAVGQLVLVLQLHECPQLAVKNLRDRVHKP